VSAGAPVLGSTVERVNPVIVLNGGSSSGKTSIARSLQRLLGTTWMTLGVDDLIRALPGGEELEALVRAQRDGGAPVGTEGSVEFGPTVLWSSGTTSVVQKPPGTQVWRR
jgi:chloramphenicol 3-O-phosphotransferase